MARFALADRGKGLESLLVAFFETPARPRPATGG
jgi:hypothetical protein